MSYNMSMDFPLVCPNGHENWVDLEAMPRLTFSRMALVETCKCKTCEADIKFFFRTRSLDEAMADLSSIPIESKKFNYYFYKTLRKALGVREKYG